MQANDEGQPSTAQAGVAVRSWTGGLRNWTQYAMLNCRDGGGAMSLGTYDLQPWQRSASHTDLLRRRCMQQCEATSSCTAILIRRKKVQMTECFLRSAVPKCFPDNHFDLFVSGDTGGATVGGKVDEVRQAVSFKADLDTRERHSAVAIYSLCYSYWVCDHTMPLWRRFAARNGHDHWVLSGNATEYDSGYQASCYDRYIAADELFQKGYDIVMQVDADTVPLAWHWSAENVVDALSNRSVSCP
jgi:hypothetical protein